MCPVLHNTPSGHSSSACARASAIAPEPAPEPERKAVLVQALFYFSQKGVQLMTRQRRGRKTSPAQQRINRAQSEASFSRLLQSNFSDGAHQIVLAYETGGYVPVGVYALQDIQDWIRETKHQLGAPLKYIRTMERVQGDDNPITIHHVVVSCRLAEAERIAARWEYGPAWVECIGPGQLPALAEQLFKASAAGSRRRSWSSSRGLIRS